MPLIYYTSIFLAILKKTDKNAIGL